MTAPELKGAIAAEQRLLDPEVRADPRAVSELVDDDFTEIGQTGIVWTRSAIMAALAGVRVRRTTLWRRRDGLWHAVAHQGTRILS